MPLNQADTHWYGIAAGFIGILFLSALYFTMNDASVDPTAPVTESDAESIPLNKNLEIIPENKMPSDEAVANTEIKNGKSTVDPSIENEFSESRDVGNPSVIATPDRSYKEAVAAISIKDRKFEKVALPLNASEGLIHTKVAEVVARVEGLESDNENVTDAEIDSLLHDAQREILADKIFRQDNSVDAMALLADVEQELDQSFRDQIFDALKDGFLKVRTAVADRNR